MAVAQDKSETGKHWMYTVRWNGTEWTVIGVATPSGATEGWLSGVSCTSTVECTAVGSYKNSTGTIVTLAERWNGSAWAVQTPPNPVGATEWSLTGVSCTSSSSCMAVGGDSSGGSSHWAFSARWNGAEWTVYGIAAPSEVQRGWLESVSCSMATECTAVGTYETATGSSLTMGERFS
jgi:hypothetical protein